MHVRAQLLGYLTKHCNLLSICQQKPSDTSAFERVSAVYKQDYEYGIAAGWTYNGK